MGKITEARELLETIDGYGGNIPVSDIYLGRAKTLKT